MLRRHQRADLPWLWLGKKGKLHDMSDKDNSFSFVPVTPELLEERFWAKRDLGPHPDPDFLA